LGWFRGLADYFILTWRLLIDPRINPLLKLLPLGSLIYLISPFDLPTPIDDVGVAEHRSQIASTVDGRWRDAAEDTEIDQAEVIDAEFRQKEP
jgi:hypothetical protein